MNMIIAPDRFGATAPPDIYWDNVMLLLSGNGANGSTSFPDEGPLDRGEPLNGTGVVVSTAAIGQYGSGTIAFDGVNDRLAYLPSEHWYLKDLEFTIEGRFSFAAGGLANDQLLMSQWEEVSNMRGWRLVWNGSVDTLEFHLSTTGANTIVILTAAFTPTADQLYHIAVDREGNDWRLYVDGVMLDKDTNTNIQFKCRNSFLRIGCNFNASSVNNLFFSGNAEEIRITRGVARYGDDGGFTPLTLPHSRQNGAGTPISFPYTIPLKNAHGETSGGTNTIPPRHWTTVAGTPQSSFGASGDGTQAFGDGFIWWYAGNTAGTVHMRQDVDIIPAHQADVDAGVIRIVCGWVQSCTTTDAQRVYVDFLDSVGAVISSAGPGLTSDGGANNWIPKGFNALVPANTRKIRFNHQSQRNDGTSNDGYGDAISARLEKIPATPAASGPQSDQWRIITNGLPFSDGYIRNAGATNSRFSIADLEMAEQPGGADQCTGGTASASSQYSASFPAANAFDATLTDGWIKGNNASNDTAAEPHWLQYTFPAPVYVTSLKMRSRSSLDSGASSGAPINFDVEYWDGSAWQVAWSVTTERFWGQNEQRQFDKPL